MPLDGGCRIGEKLSALPAEGAAWELSVHGKLSSKWILKFLIVSFWIVSFFLLMHISSIATSPRSHSQFQLSFLQRHQPLWIMCPDSSS